MNHHQYGINELNVVEYRTEIYYNCLRVEKTIALLKAKKERKEVCSFSLCTYSPSISLTHSPLHSFSQLIDSCFFLFISHFQEDSLIEFGSKLYYLVMEKQTASNRFYPPCRIFLDSNCVTLASTFLVNNSKVRQYTHSPFIFLPKNWYLLYMFHYLINHRCSLSRSLSSLGSDIDVEQYREGATFCVVVGSLFHTECFSQTIWQTL